MTIDLQLTSYDIDLIIETISYRLENDNQLILNSSLKDELEDLLALLEDQYV